VARRRQPAREQFGDVDGLRTHTGAAAAPSRCMSRRGRCSQRPPSARRR
jgi:hypothetical protein